MYSLPLAGLWTYGKRTETAGTVITRLVPPMKGAYTRLTSVWYTAGSTAHTLTVMRPLGKVSVASDAAAAQAVINITADPGAYDAYGTINTANNVIAANDFCVYQTKDGNYVVDTVASVATLAITMTTNVPTSTVEKGAPFWFFGVVGDTNPNGGMVHPQFTLPASVTTYLGTDEGQSHGFIGTLPGLQGGFEGSSLTATWPLDGQYEPLIVHSNNATVAGTIESIVAAYSSR